MRSKRGLMGLSSILLKLSQTNELFHNLLGSRFKLYRKSYSQFGEDLQILSKVESVHDYYYIDIGAHHPIYYSNTYHLHTLGMLGINVDGSKDCIKEFERLRPESKNLNILISDKAEEAIFYEFDRPTLNTLSEEMKVKALEDGAKIVSQQKMNSLSLKGVVEKYAPKNKKPFFLNVDVEGFDLQVLKTNDWEVFKPKLICIEDHDFVLEKPADCEIFSYLKDKGYNLFSKNGPSLIFELSS